MDNLRAEMGNRIKKVRKKLHFTQEAMAEKLDISIKHYGDIERGNAGISLELLINISTELNVSLDYLVKGSELNAGYIPQRLVDSYLGFSEEGRAILLNILDELPRLK